MNRKKALFLALVGACGLLLLCSRVWAWQTNINGATNFSVDSARAVAVDGAGNIVAAGSTTNSGPNPDFTVVKLDGVSGEELWHRIINGTANSIDGAAAVTVDGKGNVVTAGFTFNIGTFAAFTVIKFDGMNGEELWRQEIDGAFSSPFQHDEARAVTADSVGNVVAAGFITNTLNSNDFTVIKFDGVTGTEIWRQVISSTAAFSFNRANAVTVDGADNVVAAGVTWRSGSSTDFTVIKFDGVTGAELWRQEINGTTNGGNVANAVMVDPNGDVVAAGFTQNSGTFLDFTVIKFDGASGEELWRQEINGTANERDEAFAVTTDAVGDVVAAGITNRMEVCPYPFFCFDLSDFTVVKFSGADGTELWRRVIKGTATDSFDVARAVTADGEGNVVAAGWITNTGTGRDFTVIKFDGVSGEESWRQEINGTANGPDSALAVTVDGAGNVVAAGSAFNSGTGYDFTVVKLRGEDGGDF